MTTYKPARLHRLGAIIVDVHGMLIPAILVLFVIELLPLEANAFAACFGTFLCVGFLYCRDYLLGGRSLGKRLFGLSVVDLATGGPATGKQLLVKDLLLILGPFEAFVLLLTGRSIGERASGTAVVPDRISSPMVMKRFGKVAASAAVLGLLMAGVIQLGLNAAKQNESYTLAYDHLTGSSTFAAQEPEGAEITLTGFSATTHGLEPSHHYTFETNRHTYTVTCHPEGDGWAVCGECTEFD